MKKLFILLLAVLLTSCETVHQSVSTEETDKLISQAQKQSTDIAYSVNDVKNETKNVSDILNSNSKTDAQKVIEAKASVEKLTECVDKHISQDKEQAGTIASISDSHINDNANFGKVIEDQKTKIASLEKEKERSTKLCFYLGVLSFFLMVIDGLYVYFRIKKCFSWLK